MDDQNHEYKFDEKNYGDDMVNENEDSNLFSSGSGSKKLHCSDVHCCEKLHLHGSSTYIIIISAFRYSVSDFSLEDQQGLIWDSVQYWNLSHISVQ